MIVRDDASTDGTQELLLSLQKEFPGKVRLILERSNTFDEESPLVPLFTAAKAEYFALCEGDDYWTSNHKLQQCVDVLEANPSVVLVGHLTTQIDPRLDRRVNGIQLPVLGRPGAYNRGKLAWCHTSSIVARTRVISNSWHDYPDVRIGDLKIKVIAADAGKSCVLNQVMSVYNHHPGNYWRNLDTRERAHSSLEGCRSLLGRAEASHASLSFMCVRRARADSNELWRLGRRTEAVSLWLGWIGTLKTIRARVLLLAPPYTACVVRGVWRIRSMLSRSLN